MSKNKPVVQPKPQSQNTPPKLTQPVQVVNLGEGTSQLPQNPPPKVTQPVASVTKTIKPKK